MSYNSDSPKFRYRKTWRGKLVLQILTRKINYDSCPYSFGDHYHYVYEDVRVKSSGNIEKLLDEHIKTEYPLPNES